MGKPTTNRFFMGRLEDKGGDPESRNAVAIPVDAAALGSGASAKKLPSDRK